MTPFEITILGIPIGYVILVFGIVALSAFVAVLCTLTSKVEELTAGQAELRGIVERLVGDRMEDALNQGVRSLNDVGRS